MEFGFYHSSIVRFWTIWCPFISIPITMLRQFQNTNNQNSKTDVIRKVNLDENRQLHSGGFDKIQHNQ